MSGATLREAQRDSARRTDPSVKAEVDATRERMHGLGFGYDEIAAELARRYRLRPRKAYRIAYGWTLTQTAARLNARAAKEGTDPDAQAPMTASHLCDHEQWPYGGRRPSVYLLLLLAKVYGTNVANLLDFADHEHLPPADRLILQHAAHPHTSDPAVGYSAFGDELIRLLTERGLSRRKIAHQVPCDTGYLSKLIHGHKQPSHKIAARLEELLDANGRLLAHVPKRAADAKQSRTPRTATRGPQQQPGTGGISVTLPYLPGRLVIEISGLGAAGAAAEAADGRTLRLVPASPGDDIAGGREQAG